MWIADGWKEYELLDCGSGEKLERWGDKLLVRPYFCHAAKVGKNALRKLRFLRTFLHYGGN